MPYLLIHLAVCAFSMFVTVVLASSLLPSVFYTFPKALLGYFRGTYSWKLPLFYFGSILGWAILPGAVVAGFFYLLQWKSPDTLRVVENSWGLGWGTFIGIGIFLISRFAPSARLGIKTEFEQMAWIYGRTR